MFAWSRKAKKSLRDISGKPEIVRTAQGCFACGMRVWLDDRRGPPDGDWIWVTTAAEAIVILELDEVEELSLDHELGLGGEAGGQRTDLDVLRWIQKQVATSGYEPPRLAVHSANRPALERMQRAIDSINRLAGQPATD